MATMKQDTSTAILVEWLDAENQNTQETTLIRDASDTEKAALDEVFSSTRGIIIDSESLEDSDTEDFSESETVGFAEEALEQADSAEHWRGTQAKNVPHFSVEVRIHLVLTEGDYVAPKTVYNAQQDDDWDQWQRALKDEFKTL